MSEQLSLISARREEKSYFIENFINEVKMLLQILAVNGIRLTKPLRL